MEAWTVMEATIGVTLSFGAGLIAGATNALAGGGTFVTLPSLLAAGMSANAANATSNVALLPGAATSAWSFRDELQPIGGASIKVLAAITFVTGLAGSVLLVLTPSKVFDLIVPWMVLYALVVLAIGPRLSSWLRARIRIRVGTLMAVQAFLGLYGGYFGGGVGLMTTATYGMLAGHTPREMFAPRTLMLAVANGAAAIIFILTGLVQWSVGLPMLVGSAIGGIIGGRIGRLLPAIVIRLWTLLITAATTVIFFWHAYQ